MAKTLNFSLKSPSGPQGSNPEHGCFEATDLVVIFDPMKSFLTAHLCYNYMLFLTNGKKKQYIFCIIILQITCQI